MKRPPKLSNLQLNLSLLNPPREVVPSEQQRELAHALADLLLRAAQQNVAPSDGEAGHESETNR
jgi:hypothetical protein